MEGSAVGDAVAEASRIRLLQDRSQGQLSSGGLRVRVGILCGKPALGHHQDPLRRDIPGRKPLSAAFADSHVRRADPAVTVGGKYLAVLSVRGGSRDNDGLIDPDAGQLDVVKIQISKLVGDNTLRGIGPEIRTVHGDAVGQHGGIQIGSLDIFQDGGCKLC